MCAEAVSSLGKTVDSDLVRVSSIWTALRRSRSDGTNQDQNLPLGYEAQATAVFWFRNFPGGSDMPFLDLPWEHCLSKIVHLQGAYQELPGLLHVHGKIGFLS